MDKELFPEAIDNGNVDPTTSGPSLHYLCGSSSNDMFGLYEHIIDAKGMLYVPAPFRCGDTWAEVYSWWSPDNNRVLCFTPNRVLLPAIKTKFTAQSKAIKTLRVIDDAIKIPNEFWAIIGERSVVICGVNQWAEIWPKSLLGGLRRRCRKIFL